MARSLDRGDSWLGSQDLIDPLPCELGMFGDLGDSHPIPRSIADRLLPVLDRIRDLHRGCVQGELMMAAESGGERWRFRIADHRSLSCGSHLTNSFYHTAAEPL